MNRNAIIFLSTAVFFFGIAAVIYVTKRPEEARIGPQHVFELSHSPKFLPEDVALSKAREALALDGLDGTAWQPVRNGRTSAPSGRVDEFMARNNDTPNRGVIMFTKSSTSVRFVAVELEGNKITCRVSAGK